MQEEINGILLSSAKKKLNNSVSPSHTVMIVLTVRIVLAVINVLGVKIALVVTIVGIVETVLTVNAVQNVMIVKVVWSVVDVKSALIAVSVKITLMVMVKEEHISLVAMSTKQSKEPVKLNKELKMYKRSLKTNTEYIRTLQGHLSESIFYLNTLKNLADNGVLGVDAEFNVDGSKLLNDSLKTIQDVYKKLYGSKVYENIIDWD